MVLPDPVTFQAYATTIVSVVAIVLSSITLGWTIYKDVIRKPKFRISIAVKNIVSAGKPPDGPHIFLGALNVGPIPNRIGVPFARKNWLKRRFTDHAHGTCFIYPNHSHWATTKSAARIEAGDTATFILPYEQGCFLEDDFSQVGMSDGFGIIHWAPRRELRKAQEAYRKAFPAPDAGSAGMTQ
jgi:hypothetical protein